MCLMFFRFGNVDCVPWDADLQYSTVSAFKGLNGVVFKNLPRVLYHFALHLGHGVKYH